MRLEGHNNNLQPKKKRKKRRSKFDLCNAYNLSQKLVQSSGNSHAYADSTYWMNNSMFTDQALDLKPQQLRTAFTEEQTIILEASYQKNVKPSNTEKALVARLCGLPFETVRIWYQNRRAKEKRVQEDELARLAEKINSKKADEHLMKLERRINSFFDEEENNHEENEEEEESFIRQLLREKRKQKTDYEKPARESYGQSDCQPEASEEFIRENQREKNRSNNKATNNSKLLKEHFEISGINDHDQNVQQKNNTGYLTSNIPSSNQTFPAVFNGNVSDRNIPGPNVSQHPSPFFQNNFLTAGMNLGYCYPPYQSFPSALPSLFTPTYPPFHNTAPFTPFQNTLSVESMLLQLAAMGVSLTQDQLQFLEKSRSFQASHEKQQGFNAGERKTENVSSTSSYSSSECNERLRHQRSRYFTELLRNDITEEKEA